MYPFPVRKFDSLSIDIMELINLMKERGNKSVIGDFSIALSKYKEGNIMNLSDKIVSMSNLKDSNIEGYKALITGKNKNLTLM